MNVLEYLRYPIFQRALVAACVAGGTFSLLGVVIVTMNLTTIRFALMHTALLGAACGMAVGWSPLTGALLAIIVASLALGPWSSRLGMDTGLTGALFMTGSIAAAFLIFYRTGVPAMEAFGLFTGSVLTTTRAEVLAISGLGLAIVLVYIVFYREIQLVLYDRELAEVLGVPSEAIRSGLLLLTGLAVGLAMRIVGALMIDALILIPALSAMRLGSSLARVLVISSILGVVSAGGGLLLSMSTDLPSGATMTMAGVLVLALITATGSIGDRLCLAKQNEPRQTHYLGRR